ADRLTAACSNDLAAFSSSLEESQLVFGCGAAGARLLTTNHLEMASKLQVAIDLNAVPPTGIEGIELTDKGKHRGNRFDYGALGVGGLKMKIHKACIAALFESNQFFLDCHEMLAIGQEILSGQKPE
ncbi:MAG TPA: bifunctional NADP-dependent methylenetetrahydromethanopterin dehydrogenase/methylenetetrahydrofolate dehydrogenase, partial [Pirellula sp.]|nr:bifunctional NADP-dependent methylenetetrahydromethanopterin dehydrogenase/methylenetetrahydrofolate dehydrogenase [Pirellula sp.]